MSSNFAKFIRTICTDPGALERFNSDPWKAIEAADLSEEEVELLKSGDLDAILKLAGVDKSEVMGVIKLMGSPQE